MRLPTRQDGVENRDKVYSDIKGRYTRGVLLLEHAPGSFCMYQYTRGGVFNFAQFAPGACSQIYRGAFCGVEILLPRMKYTHEIVGTHGGALLPERAPGACSGSKIPRVYRL